MKGQNKIVINTVSELAHKIGVPLDILLGIAKAKNAHFEACLERTAPDKLRTFYKADHVLYPIHEKICNKILADIEFPKEIQGGIKDNSTYKSSSIHAGKAYVLTLDIKNFFPSVYPEKVFYALHKIGCAPTVAELLTDLVTADRHLPQGFSTSPRIAGLLLIEINNKLREYLGQYGFSHTIWFDDLIISGEREVDRKIITKIKQLFCEEGYVIHKEKGMPESTQQVVLGNVVNAKASKPKKEREYILKAVHICEKIGIREYTRQHGKTENGVKLKIRQQADYIGGRLGELVGQNREKYSPVMTRWNELRKKEGLLPIVKSKQGKK